MSMVINNNMMSINTQRNFSNSSNGMASAMEKLSSGLKINTGKDDPSGLTISEQLRSQKAGLERAKQNTSEAMNVMSIAEGAMNEMNSILKKMKALAIHSNSTGVTSPDQIAADQAEMDSAIQTIDRIAQTTKFAGENLINGNKDISYDLNTTVKATQNNSLVNERESSFSQIFKREGYEVSISFNGTDAVNGTVDACGLGTRVNFAAQASKAYFEVDVQSSTHASDLKADGTFSHEQQFTLTGNKGSRQYTIASGAHIGEMVKQIQTGADATGVTASLVFNSTQDVKLNSVTNTDVGDLSVARASGAINVFNNANATAAADADKRGIASVTKPDDNVIFGYNTDGQGNIYIKYTSDTTAELYKDASMSGESLVGTAARGAADGVFTVTEANYSDLTGLTWKLENVNAANMYEVKGTYLNFGGIEGGTDEGVSASGALFGAANGYSDDDLYLAGVELGKNTSDEGEIFLKTIVDDDGNAEVFAYRHKDMKEEDLVAKGNYATADAKIILNEIRNVDETAGTGLGIIINTAGTLPAAADGTKATYESKISFKNLGARVYAENYGESQYAQVTQDKGSSLHYYADPGNADSRTLVEAGQRSKQTGQDATLSINGRQVRTDGLRLKMATQDIQADFTFNEGKVGSTTLAQVGYGVGSVFTQVGALTIGSNEVADVDATKNLTGYLANTGHTTTEQAEDFEGGMQLQIGEGAGSNDRTIVGMKSMTSENLGRVTKTGMYEVDGKPIYTEKTFTMKDMLGGGSASLGENATLAMEIIEKSINDVAGMRATIGAMQSNLLQTNENNLAVTIENVTKTESGIRDADMAETMSELTKQQVLQSAAMSMMGQANQSSQNVLQLLR